MLNFILVAVFTATFCVALIVGLRIEHWPFIENFAQRDLQFGDLGALLVISDFFQSQPNGDPYHNFPIPGYTPNYPLLLPKILAMFDLGLNEVLLVGVISSVILWISLVALMVAILPRHNTHLKITYFLLLMMISFSPPVMLLLERGNYDIWVFLLVVLAGLVLHRLPGFALSLVGLAATLKLFPIAGLIAFWGQKKYMNLAIAVGAVFLIYALLIRDQLTSVSANTPKPSWQAFGVLVIPSYLDLYVSNSVLIQIAVNLTIHLAGFLVGFWVLKTCSAEVLELTAAIHKSNPSRGLMLVGGSVSVFTYVLGNSYDYRLVFLLAPLAALLVIEKPNGLGVNLITGTAFVLFWSFAGNQISPLGDFAIIPLLTIYGFLVFKILHPGSIWLNRKSFSLRRLTTKGGLNE